MAEIHISKERIRPNLRSIVTVVFIAYDVPKELCDFIVDVTFLHSSQEDLGKEAFPVKNLVSYDADSIKSCGPPSIERLNANEALMHDDAK